MATAITPATLLVIEKNEMIRLLHTEQKFSDLFISHLLSRNFRSEGDLVDQLFNSSEKRLARALLLLANYGSKDPPAEMVPRVTQDVLAEMVGTTRSRVNYFMKQFAMKGFIGYKDGLHVNSSLLTVVLEK
jgi:CRP-like cAMP-binding protein